MTETYAEELERLRQLEQALRLILCDAEPYSSAWEFHSMKGFIHHAELRDLVRPPISDDA